MHPWQCDLGLSAAKHNCIAHAAAAARKLDAAIPLRSAETDLQNTKELRTMATQIAAPKPDGSRRPRRKTTILKHYLKGFLKRKSSTPKNEKKKQNNCCQSTIRHFHAPMTMRFRTLSCKTQLYRARSRSSEETWRSHSTAICRDGLTKHKRITHNGYTNCSSKTRWISTPTQKNDDFEALFKRIFKKKIINTQKWKKKTKQLLPKHHLPLSCTHCNAI